MRRKLIEGIEAEQAGGFDDATQRTVTENARTLGLVRHGFER